MRGAGERTGRLPSPAPSSSSCGFSCSSSDASAFSSSPSSSLCALNSPESSSPRRLALLLPIRHLSASSPSSPFSFFTPFAFFSFFTARASSCPRYRPPPFRRPRPLRRRRRRPPSSRALRVLRLRIASPRRSVCFSSTFPFADIALRFRSARRPWRRRCAQTRRAARGPSRCARAPAGRHRHARVVLRVRDPELVRVNVHQLHLVVCNAVESESERDDGRDVISEPHRKEREKKQKLTPPLVRQLQHVALLARLERDDVVVLRALEHLRERAEVHAERDRAITAVLQEPLFLEEDRD